jgi:hypothetical protein
MEESRSSTTFLALALVAAAIVVLASATFVVVAV